MEFKGQCKGVRLQSRNLKENDNHISIQLLVEDDENWYESGNPFSSYWIDELIQQLQNAKLFIETQVPEIAENGHQYGFKFK